jgi:4-aminobutyrate aminotransferase-like enzyme
MKYTEKELVEKTKKYSTPLPGFTPLVMTEAKGCIVKDINGREYIDGISICAGPASIGSAHPKVVNAVIEQVKKLPAASPWCVNIPRVELAEKLTKILPQGLNKFQFFCGGGEAVEFAIRTAIRSLKKREVISLYTGYHGTSFGLLSLGGSWNRKGLPIVPGFRQIPPAYCYRCFYGKEYPQCDFECAKALESMIQWGSSGEVMGFLLEPMMGVGGHVIPPKDYFQIVREICDKYGALLIFDEIQTGFGRTGKMWAADYYEVNPDIMVIGKAMGGGIPISAAIFSEKIPLLSEEETESLNTFNGNPLACAAASAVIDVIAEENLTQKAAETGSFMMERLKGIEGKHPLIGEIRGAGLFIGVELVKDKETKERANEEAKKVVAECQKRGVLLMVSYNGKGNVVKIKPPLNIERSLVEKIVDVLDESFSVVEKSFTK